MEKKAINEGKFFSNNANQYPLPGSPEETDAFNFLQNSFAKQFLQTFPDHNALRTIVIIPSLTLDEAILSKLKGRIYYEERMLCMLMLLRMPRTNIVYVTSMPVDEIIIDYYLHLLPGITGFHARQRLTLLNCFDNSPRPLTQKILERPRLIERIRNVIPDKNNSHLVCFNVTELEKTLSVQLGLPLFGCDPALLHLGTKSGSRELFKNCRILLPAGFENLQTKFDVVQALYNLKQQKPFLRKAVIKLNDGFSGEGNAVFSYSGLEMDNDLKNKIDAELSRRIKIIAPGVNFENYMAKLFEMKGIVEEFIDGDIKTSPSVQCRINPGGSYDIISTHDQLLDSETGQIFLGATFPANDDYKISIAAMAEKIAQALLNKGVLGRFSIDFISVMQNNEWKNYAIEINLRKGGTTHPYLMLQFLTDGNYDHSTGEYYTAGGQQRFYFATDNLQDDLYKGITPRDLIDIAIYHKLIYDSTKQEGIMFHMLGALSQYGKIGLVCIASNREKAIYYYQKVIEVLATECS